MCFIVNEILLELALLKGEIEQKGVMVYVNLPILVLKDDRDVNTSTREVTLEEMCSAAKEVDGTGTVDTATNTAERLKLNQATSTTASDNSNQQVTIWR